MGSIEEYNRLGGIPPDPVYHVADDSYQRSLIVEEYADNLLDKCRKFEFAKALNEEHDIYDGDLLPKIMQTIAEWSGKPDNSHAQMKKLHNLLLGEVQVIAERECYETRQVNPDDV